MARRGRLILIVDPDLDFVEDARVLLAHERALTARSLDEAEEIAVGGRVDAALLGPSFGHEGGVRAAAALLGVDPSIHLVLAANVVTNRVLLAALRSGFADVVDMPLTQRKLTAALGARTAARVEAGREAVARDVVLELALADDAATNPAPVPAATPDAEMLGVAGASTAPIPAATAAPVPAATPDAEMLGVAGASTAPIPAATAAPVPAAAPAVPMDPVATAFPPVPVEPAAAAPPPEGTEPLPPPFAPPPPTAPPLPSTAEVAPPAPSGEVVDLPPTLPSRAAAPGRAQPSGESRVILVMAGKGGSGKSVTATNLALALTFAVGEGEVAIVDADLQFGDVALLLQMDPVHSIAEVARQVDDLSEARLDALLLRHESGLRVLPAPRHPAAAEGVAPKAVVQVVEMMRRLYRHVVVDTGAVLDDVLMTLLDHADEVVLVVDMDLTSVKNAKVTLDILRAGGYPMERMHLVVNRINAKARLDLVEVERSLGLRTAGAIPSDRLVPRSVNEGVPVVALSPRSRVARAFTALARLFLPGKGRKGS